MVASMACASQRISGRPKVKKDPVNFQMPKALVESKITDKSQKSSSLSDPRSVALCFIDHAEVFFFALASHII